MQLDYNMRQDFCVITLCCHDPLQAITFHEQLLISFLAPVVIAFLDVDDSAPDGRYALGKLLSRGSSQCTGVAHLHNDVGQGPLKFSETVVLIWAVDVYQ